MSTAEVNGPRWGAIAAGRAEHYANMARPAWEAVAAATGLAAGLRVLDVGCGSGEFCRLAADRGATVTGLDAAIEMIEIARRRVPEGDFVVGPIERLPWGDGEFDLVTGFNAFQLATDMAAALAEARRVTRAGGRVAVCNWGPRKDRQILVFTDALRALQPPGSPLPAPGLFGEPGVLEDLARQAGLNPGQATEVAVPFVAPDEESLALAMLTAPSALSAIEHVGAETARRAVLDAAAPFRRPDGSYRVDNTFVYVIAQN